MDEESDTGEVFNNKLTDSEDDDDEPRSQPGLRYVTDVPGRQASPEKTPSVEEMQPISSNQTAPDSSPLTNPETHGQKRLVWHNKGQERTQPHQVLSHLRSKLQHSGDLRDFNDVAHTLQNLDSLIHCPSCSDDEGTDDDIEDPWRDEFCLDSLHTTSRKSVPSTINRNAMSEDQSFPGFEHHGSPRLETNSSSSCPSLQTSDFSSDNDCLSFGHCQDEISIVSEENAKSRIQKSHFASVRASEKTVDPENFIGRNLKQLQDLTASVGKRPIVELDETEAALSNSACLNHACLPGKFDAPSSMGEPWTSNREPVENSAYWDGNLSQTEKPSAAAAASRYHFKSTTMPQDVLGNRSSVENSAFAGNVASASFATAHNGIAETWSECWTFPSEIECSNLFLGRSVRTDVHQSALTKESKHRRASERRERVPRMFHRRLGSGNRGRRDSELPGLMAHSPLLVLFNEIKKSGLDVAAILENSEYFGITLPLPCMQCFEGKARSGYTRGDLPPGSHTDGGRCQDCGGQVATLSSMGKMIRLLRDVLAEKDFVVHDVYPDGNCVFGTVTDQLRVRGDFRYTVQSLREAVVEYLRTNPKAEDGTPLEMFLTDESWEQYLDRMSLDGEWGDHLVLNALTNVLDTEIHIYGGSTGENRTVLKPRSCEENGESDHAEAQPEETVGADEELNPIPASKKVLMEGVSKSGVASRTMEENSIHLGHFGESHYVSLRPRTWQEKIVRNRLSLLTGQMDRSLKMKCPVGHLDFILRHTIQLQYIHSYMGDFAESFPESFGEEDNYQLIFLGPIMCKMVVDYKNTMESISPDVSIFFPTEEARVSSEETVINVLQIPNDSVVQELPSSNHPMNLVMETVGDNSLTVQLKPISPDMWREALIPTKSGDKYVKAFSLQSIGVEDRPITYRDETITLKRTFAFKCEWPEAARSWATRTKPSGFPDSTLEQTIISLGCHVVPVVHDRDLKYVTDCHVTAEMIDSQVTWCLSFALGEKLLCKHFTENQRQCYLIFSAMLDFMTNSDAKVPYAIQKTVFFYACESIEKSDWLDEPGRCLLMMFSKFSEGLHYGFIPHYFIGEQNLLQYLPQAVVENWARAADSLSSDPIVPLFFILDKLNVTATELGALIDDVLDDLFRYNCHVTSISRDRCLQFQGLLSAGGTLVENLIYQGEYRYGMKALETMQDYMNKLERKHVPLHIVIERLLAGMALGYRWCMGLFIDLSLQTTISTELATGFEVVHITEIFGPEISEEMPNVVVPNSYSLESGDLKFPEVASAVIVAAGKPQLIVKCLKHYLTEYKRIAGEHIVINRKGFCPAWSLRMLKRLHLLLLDNLVELERPQEFRPFMPTLSAIAEMLQDQRSYADLAYAWNMLGEPETAAQYTCNHRTPQEMLKDLMGSLMAQAY